MQLCGVKVQYKNWSPVWDPGVSAISMLSRVVPHPPVQPQPLNPTSGHVDEYIHTCLSLRLYKDDKRRVLAFLLASTLACSGSLLQESPPPYLETQVGGEEPILHMYDICVYMVHKQTHMHITTHHTPCVRML